MKAAEVLDRLEEAIKARTLAEERLARIRAIVREVTLPGENRNAAETALARVMAEVAR